MYFKIGVVELADGSILEGEQEKNQHLEFWRSRGGLFSEEKE